MSLINIVTTAHTENSSNAFYLQLMLDIGMTFTQDVTTLGMLFGTFLWLDDNL